MGFPEVVRQVYLGQGINILDKMVYEKPRRVWPAMARRNSIGNFAAMGDLMAEVLPGLEEKYPVVVQVAQAMREMVVPAGEVFAAQLERGLLDRPMSWREVCPEGVEVLERGLEMRGGLGSLGGEYQEIAQGLVRLMAINDPGEWDHLGDEFLKWAAGLAEAGLPVIIVGVDDWGLNPKRVDEQPLAVAEVDIAWGLPVVDGELGGHVNRLNEKVGGLLGRESRREGVVYDYVGGAGWQTLSVTTGNSGSDGRWWLAQNISKTQPTVGLAMERLGVGSAGAWEVWRKIYAGHESAHGFFNSTPARYAEAVVDSASAWGMMKAGGREMEAAGLLGEAVAQAMEKETGADNNDGYRVSGRTNLRLMRDSGVVSVGRDGERLDLGRIDEWLAGMEMVIRLIEGGEWGKVEELAGDDAELDGMLRRYEAELLRRQAAFDGVQTGVEAVELG
ncbi:hypothetical protein A2876_01765 [Candidatus Amesbacteria bacterium RIFCSPHIGHO2_01_FULL_48_32b]|uniref:Uncharacterized protein n=1 Tax=Candidatus Amesbacteria bacterium RIFCSPHIGHO2_01_FULL_48_32b TaxID=1797253 RepID=A0A1F4YDM2_9BACT|nr:MAG: hypothetical protein A2876_01765 [Candidatus Amesbacteria bacterium RIFCSPHIGHO2_01_FULL_48_32b]